MTLAVMEIAIEPIGHAEPHLSPLIARCVQALDRAGVEYEVTPMGTVVQAEVSRLFELAREMHDLAASAGAPRVMTTLRIDETRAGGHALRDRVRAVESALGHAAYRKAG